MQPKKPTKDEITAAYGQTVPDIIAPGLRVLFVGINPSLYSAAVGYHFARPGNRFWPAIALGGLTARRLAPHESDILLNAGYGITNVVDRATATAQELAADEYIAGGVNLAAKIAKFEPKIVAFLGIGSYRSAFAKPNAVVGPQDESIAKSRVWVLPNPSGLNAHYTLAALGGLFAALRAASDFEHRD